MIRRRLCLLAVAALTPAMAGAQQIRARSTTTARYAELRPLRYDTTTAAFVADAVRSAMPLTQDLEVSAWGFGVPGLRAYGLVRARTALGSDLVWPRSDDHFDALYAYLELERPRYRVRGGRQQRFSGLGFYAFDGLTTTWRPMSTMRLETYGGRGLARGFLEPASSPAIRSLDPLRPDQGTILLGASMWAAPTRTSALTLAYQRELLADRSGLVSERAALDWQVGVGSRLYLTGSADADIATSHFGRMRLSAQVRLPRRSFLQVEVFRYRPLFDLTTIWGVFSPQSHTGLGASMRVAPTAELALTAGIMHRRYDAARVTPFLDPDDHATQLQTGVRWGTGRVSVDGGWSLNTGFGGAQSSGDASVAVLMPAGWHLGGHGTAFQQQGEFRVGDGTVYGFGFEVRGPIASRASVRADVMRYWHRRPKGATGLDWSQTRALFAVDWAFGADPDRVSTRP